MSRLKKGDKVPYTQISNAVLYDNTISFKAKGLYAYMLAKPDEWNFSSKRIANETKDGIDAIQSALNELIEAGLLDYSKASSGRSVYTIYNELPKRENPAKGTKPKRENPLKGKPLKGKTPSIINKEINKQRVLEEEEEVSSFASQTKFINFLRLEYPNKSIQIKNGNSYYFGKSGNLFSSDINKKVASSMALEIYKRMYKQQTQLIKYLKQKV